MGARARLLRFNRQFAAGIVLLAVVASLACLSFFSPYPPNDSFVVPPDLPPSWAYPMGTTSRGQDLFWLLSFAIRNTLLFGIVVAVLSRILALVIGLVAGYSGGVVDRALMSLNDTFIVIPLFPILVLFYFVMREHMSWGLLALMMACLGWAYDARLIRSVAMSLRSREFTETGIFSGMSTRQILVEEHLPYVLPIVFSTTMNNINWSIGLEVTLSVLGFTDINTPTIGVLIYWANQHTALVAGHLVVDRLPGAAGRHDLHRAVPARRVDERIHRSAQPPRPEPAMTTRPHRVEGLRAYYRTSAFGVEREVRAVDDVSLRIAANEIYGLAGESSCGKTTLIKTIAAAIRPPLRGAGRLGDVQFRRPAPSTSTRADRKELAAIRWRHLSYIMQGSMSVLNPVRRVRHSFVDFAFRHIGKPMPAVPRDRARPSAAPATRARGARGLSAPALRRHAPARDDRAGHRLPARIHHRRRADHGARRDRAEGRAGDDPRDPARAGLVDHVRHPRHGGPRQPHRSAGHHVCRPAGGGGPHRRRLPRARGIPIQRT